MLSRRFLVSGIVQGVSYRVSTQHEAECLGLTGWVRNLPDGRVEVVASGESSIVEKFESWLRQGPRFARVNSVDSEDVDPQEFGHFEIRY